MMWELLGSVARVVVWVLSGYELGSGGDFRPCRISSFVVVLCVASWDSAASGEIMCGTMFGARRRTVLIVGTGLGLVDLIFAFWAQMWPIVDARGSGGKFRRCFVVIVGNDDRYPQLIACATVERAGENSAREMNSALSAIVGASTTVFIEWEYCGTLSIFQSLFFVLDPCRIVLPL